MNTYAMVEQVPPAADVAATRHPLRAPIAPFLLDTTVAHYPAVFVQHCSLAPAHDPVSGVVSDYFVQVNFSHAVPVTCQVDGYLHKGVGYAGDIVVLPRDMPATYTWAQSSTLLHLYLASSLVASVADDVRKTSSSPPQLTHRFLLRDPLIEQIGLAFLHELRSQSLSGPLYADALALTLTLHLLRTYSARASVLAVAAPRVVNHPLGEVIEYIDAHLDQPLSLVQLAAVVGLSPYYFARLFKQCVGVAPHQYVIQQRVTRAKQLLLEGTLSVAQVAHCVGFADQSHLARHFRHHVGVSPMTLRKERKNLPKERKNVQDGFRKTRL